MDPNKLPKKLGRDLPPHVEDHRLKDAAVTGRSVEELILEILDQYLQAR